MSEIDGCRGEEHAPDPVVKGSERRRALRLHRCEFPTHVLMASSTRRVVAIGKTAITVRTSSSCCARRKVSALRTPEASEILPAETRTRCSGVIAAIGWLLHPGKNSRERRRQEPRHGHIVAHGGCADRAKGRGKRAEIRVLHRNRCADLRDRGRSAAARPICAMAGCRRGTRTR